VPRGCERPGSGMTSHVAQDVHLQQHLEKRVGGGGHEFRNQVQVERPGRRALGMDEPPRQPTSEPICAVRLITSASRDIGRCMRPALKVASAHSWNSDWWFINSRSQAQMGDHYPGESDAGSGDCPIRRLTVCCRDPNAQAPATGAMHLHTSLLSLPERHLDLHHDDCPTAAAWPFATALRSCSVPAVTAHGLRGQTPSPSS
jgi:hypothetical protein